MSYILFGGKRDSRPNAMDTILDVGPNLDKLLMPLKADFTAEEFIESHTVHRVRRLHDNTTLWFHLTSRRAVEWWQVLNTSTNKIATFGGRCWDIADFPRAVLSYSDTNKIVFETAPVRSVRPTQMDLSIFMTVISQGDADSNPQQMYVNRKMRQAQQNVVADMAKAVRACSVPA